MENSLRLNKARPRRLLFCKLHDCYRNEKWRRVFERRMLMLGKLLFGFEGVFKVSVGNKLSVSIVLAQITRIKFVDEPG